MKTLNEFKEFYFFPLLSDIILSMTSPNTFFLFLSEPFGFGPISSSITIARQIKKQNPLIICLFIGCGTSYQLAEHSGMFDEIHYTDDLSQNVIKSFNSQLNSNNCIVIANTYPTGVAVARQAKFKCVFIDTLFWMWSSLPIDLYDVEKYYIEDFRCVDLRVDRFGASPKFKIVPPLIDISVIPKPVTHPLLLVSLGGIDSNIYDFPVFYERLIEHISKDPRLIAFSILVCGGGKKFRENEFRKYEHSRLKIGCLSPQEYISQLKSADLVLASAGLHSFYENYFLKKNVMFLPPQSYSQYLQLKYIMANFEGVHATNFEQLGMLHTLKENMPEKERIYEVKRTNEKLIDSAIFSKFLIEFNKFYSGTVETDWSQEKNLSVQDQDGATVLAKDILLNV